MFAIGNDELKKNGRIGTAVECPHCGKEHVIEHGERIHSDGTRTPDTLLAFYKCGEHLYLAGIDGFAV